MGVAESEADLAEFQPGLVLGRSEPLAPVDTDVRTDIGCLLRVRASAVPLDASSLGVPESDIARLFLDGLPGSPDGEECAYVIRHRQLDEWQEDVFAGEYRTRYPSVVRQFFLNGGGTLHLVDLLFHVPPLDLEGLREDEDPESVEQQREDTAYLSFYSWALERTDDYGRGSINQYAFPELWTQHPHIVPDVWSMATAFCKRTGNRFVVADAAPPWRVVQEEERRRQRLAGHTPTGAPLPPLSVVGGWFREERWKRHADIPFEVQVTLDAVHETRRILARREIDLSCLAVYWPWVKDLRGLDVPPCGALAGVYARSDDEHEPVGVKKSPANEAVKGVADLSVHVDERPQNLLQRDGVNVLQARPGEGILVWGARTLCEQAIWKYVNVRRLIGYIGKQLELDSQWAVFENNTPDLRSRVARDVEYFLHELWEIGALDGATPEDAFKVLCSEENNTDEVIEKGMLVANIWVRPVQTNEFVHLQLTHGDASKA